MQPKPDEIQIVLELGGEAGSMTMQGVSDGRDNWRFRIVRDERGMADLVGEEEFSPEELFSEGEWVMSWDEALAQLDTYRSWPRYVPMSVHPLFAARVLAAAQDRLSSSNDRNVGQESRWKVLCARHCSP